MGKAFAAGCMAFVYLFDPEMGDFQGDTRSDCQAGYNGLVSEHHALSNNKTCAEVELWAEDNPDPSLRVMQIFFDLAAQWMALPNLQLDIGTNIGLNRAAPDLQSYIGISQRF